MVFWNYFWKRYVLDSFREELFSIRARLFDFALENKGFSFSDELYITFELILNGTIRFGHNVSLLNALTFGLLNQLTFPGFKIESKLHQNFNNLLENIDHIELRDEIASLRKSYEDFIVKYLILSSFIILFSTTLFIIIAFVYDLVLNGFKVTSSIMGALKKRVKELYARPVKRLQYQFESEMIAYNN